VLHDRRSSREAKIPDVDAKSEGSADPLAVPGAFWTDEAVRPTPFKESASAVSFVGKPRGEGKARHGAMVIQRLDMGKKIERVRRAVNGAGRDPNFWPLAICPTAIACHLKPAGSHSDRG
jgi:hypothetical protein